MSDFRDRLQPASFRGVPFFVADSSMEFGRRTHRSEFPYHDRPFVDDMGKKARDYSVDAFLVHTEDSDLFKLRQALIDALEKEGPGTLIHPRLGALRVQAGVTTWRPKPNADMERFSISFVDAPVDMVPTVAVDTLDKLLGAADTALTAQQSLFERAANFTRQATHVIDAARDDINRGMQGIKKWARVGNQMSDSLTQLSLSIDSAVNDIGDLILTPRQLAGNICTLVRQAMALPGTTRSILEGYRNLNALWGDADPIPQTTPSRVVQQQNRNAIALVFSSAATIEASRRISQLASNLYVTSNAQSPFSSANEAYAARDELLQALEQIALTADASVYESIVALQANLNAHIAAHGNTLPRVERVSYQNTLPLVVVAHMLDGNINRIADLTRRNRIAHPLFIATGTELEVLRG